MKKKRRKKNEHLLESECCFSSRLLLLPISFCYSFLWQSSPVLGSMVTVVLTWMRTLPVVTVFGEGTHTHKREKSRFVVVDFWFIRWFRLLTKWNTRKIAFGCNSSGKYLMACMRLVGSVWPVDNNASYFFSLSLSLFLRCCWLFCVLCVNFFLWHFRSHRQYLQLRFFFSSLFCSSTFLFTPLYSTAHASHAPLWTMPMSCIVHEPLDRKCKWRYRIVCSFDWLFHISTIRSVSSPRYINSYYYSRHRSELILI